MNSAERMGERKMKKTILVVIAVLAAMLMVLPTWAFVDVDSEDYDEYFEMFGPHIDSIFVRMYAGVPAAYAALQGALIDVIDWPATLAEKTAIEGDPDIATMYYPPPPSERGYYEVTFNQNNETTLGPPGPADPNPKKPNPTADVDFRNASAWAINRTYLEDVVSQGMAVIMYSEICPYMIGWLHTDLPNKPEWSHPFSGETDLTVANATLEKGGFPTNPATGWRYPDFNENGVEDAGEDWDGNDQLDIYVRYDRFRKMSGEHLAGNLLACGVPILITYCTGGFAYVQCMINKDFHMYTGGWIFMGPEPSYLWDLHHIDNYWHDPESAPPNYQRINDPVLNTYLDGVMYGSTLHGSDFAYPTYPTPDTKYVNSSCWRAQERMAFMVHDYPLMATLGVKGVYKTYTDTGKTYDGLKWKGIANEQGFGINSWFSFLNGYPEGYLEGTGAVGDDMMMQYGWKETVYPQHLNILYAEWYWDFEVLGKIYDTMVVRNPYLPAQYVPWLINYYEEGTYLYHGVTCKKILISLKNGIKWFDGAPLTANDIAFSVVEASNLLLDKGYSPPWWYPSVQHVISYSEIDPLTIELLVDSNSAWATLWALLAPPIIPEHIVRGVIDTGDPTGFYLDADAGPGYTDPSPPHMGLLGTGPFKFVSFSEGVSLEMEANKEYFRICPVMPEFNVTWGPRAPYYNEFETTTYPKCRADPGYPQTWSMVTINYSARNQWLNWTALDTVGGYLTCDIFIYMDGILDTSYTDVNVPCGGSVTYTRTYNLSKCLHNATLAIHIKGPDPLRTGLNNTWICNWQNATLPIWVTIKYDIAGTKFLGKVVSPDCKVEGKDNGFVSAAYNTEPGDERWRANADVTGDYRCEGKDVGWIAKFYGKW